MAERTCFSQVEAHARLRFLSLKAVVDDIHGRAGAADAGINARLVLASCWPVLTMQMRPFSNSLEVRLLPSYEPYAFQAVLAIRFDP